MESEQLVKHLPGNLYITINSKIQIVNKNKIFHNRF